MQEVVYQIFSESAEVCRRYDKNSLAYYVLDTVYTALRGKEVKKFCPSLSPMAAITAAAAAATIYIGVDMAGILGDAWRAPKVGQCRVG